MSWKQSAWGPAVPDEASSKSTVSVRTDSTVAPLPKTARPPNATQPHASLKSSKRCRLPALVTGNPIVVLSALWAVLFAYFSLTQGHFLTSANIAQVIEENSIIFVVAMAETAVVLMGGIDLSSGGLLSLSGLILVVSNHGVPEWAAIILTVLGAGALGALVNGLPIGLARMNPFVVTLGSSSIFFGLANVFTQGNTYVLNHNSIASTLANTTVAAVPVALIIMALSLLAFYVVLRWTFYGRDIYAVGGNSQAATLAGVRVGTVRVVAYLLVGLSVGLASVLQAGRVASVSPTNGTGLELLAVAAVLLGGTSLAGGKGSVVGTAMAVLFLATVDNGLRISGVSSFWQSIVTGTILILAVGLEQFRSRFASRGGSQTPKASATERNHAS